MGFERHSVAEPRNAIGCNSVEPRVNRLAAQNKMLVLQQIPIDDVTTGERMLVRQGDADAGIPISFDIAARRWRSIDQKSDVETTLHNSRDLIRSRTFVEFHCDGGMRRPIIVQQRAQATIDSGRENSDADHALRAASCRQSVRHRMIDFGERGPRPIEEMFASDRQSDAA
nr:hypothetical protein [Methylocystis sp. SC2]